MSSNPWLAHRTNNPLARLRLFCFHHAGGAANVFRDWAHRLPKSIDVCPVQLPGHSTRTREPLVENLHQLSTAAAQGLRPAFDLPFAFFGHSMGALLAFQVVRELQDRGEAPPVHLFVAGRVAPSVVVHGPPLHGLSDQELIHGLRHRYNAIPDELLREPELLTYLLPAIRADLRLHETYVHRIGSPTACAITAYGGSRDPNVTDDDLDAWKQETTGQFTKQLFDGDHFFIHAKETAFMNALSTKLRILADALTPVGLGY
jgi:medium-chain acyl-[acyl-carrier-protein] hydrolase